MYVTHPVTHHRMVSHVPNIVCLYMCKKEVYGPGRVALRVGNQKINLHPERGNDIGLLARIAAPGTEDLCFITNETPEAVIAHLSKEGVTGVEGPVSRTGALGPIMSVYFRDPDGNLIEVSSYDSGNLI